MSDGRATGTRMAGRCGHPDCPDGIFDTDIPCEVCGIGKPDASSNRVVTLTQKAADALADLRPSQVPNNSPAWAEFQAALAADAIPNRAASCPSCGLPEGRECRRDVCDDKPPRRVTPTAPCRWCNMTGKVATRS